MVVRNADVHAGPTGRRPVTASDGWRGGDRVQEDVEEVEVCQLMLWRMKGRAAAL